MNNSSIRSRAGLLLLLFPWSGLAAADISYENGIRQLLDKHCLECHGSNAPTMAEFKADKENTRRRN